MRPSELKASKTLRIERESKPIRTSNKADPPITEEEARTAQPSICPWHGGLVVMTGDVDGSVHYCPKGKQYWRYQKKGARFAKALRPDSRGIV